MEEADHPAGTTRTLGALEWAGYLGLAPLVACLAAVALLPEHGARELAQRGAIIWGALLLGWAATLHVGGGLGGPLRAQGRRVAAALTLLPVAAAAVLLGGQRALALLVVAHGSWWLYEHRVLGTALPPAYLAQRRPWVLATCGLLAFTMILSDTTGLS